MDLGVGTHIVINYQLPGGIWQFQKLFWNHERQDTMVVNQNLEFIIFCVLSGNAKFVKRSKIDNTFSMTIVASKFY